MTFHLQPALRTAAAAMLVALGIGSTPVWSQSTGWKNPENNNGVIKAQKEGGSPREAGKVKIDFFGHMAFRITSPQGVSVLIDPWRNDPTGAWGLWFPNDFPPVYVDAVLSTHAHFDHDAVDKPHADMVLERMAGRFELGDVAITGYADKHQCDAPGWFKWSDAVAESGGHCPPDNPMQLDNVIYIIETGGMRIAHWGDNRPEPDARIMKALEGVDVLIMNIDGSQHILSYAQIDSLLKRIKPHAIVPGHYLTHGVSTTLTTLQTADEWVDKHGNAVKLTTGSLEIQPAEVKAMDQKVMYFGSNFVKK